jgi:hypothetical protein
MSSHRTDPSIPVPKAEQEILLKITKPEDKPLMEKLMNNAEEITEAEMGKLLQIVQGNNKKMESVRARLKSLGL